VNALADARVIVHDVNRQTAVVPGRLTIASQATLGAWWLDEPGKDNLGRDESAKHISNRAQL
jgi:hypothetical protein